MTAVVWKFLFKAEPGQYTAFIPTGGQILTTGLDAARDYDGGYMALWALVDPKAKRRHRKVVVVFTGQEFNPDGMDYVGTVVRNGYVMHVFIETEAAS